MSEPKTSKRRPTGGAAADPTMNDAAPSPAIDADNLVEATPTNLDTNAVEVLNQVNTFLFHIPTYAARARLHGYDQAEHEIGTSLWTKAAGRHRPLSHWIGEQATALQSKDISAEQLRLLQEIDVLENLWFPRIRAILERCIPAANHERFFSAFFKDLSQQPLGPSVTDSVSALISRFQELARSDEPGAQEAYKLGVKRGLTAKKIEHVLGLIAQAKKGMSEVPTQPKISAEELATAKAEQLEALAQLRPWYKDWATTFRQVFGKRTLIKLGLASLKRTAPEAPPAPEEAEDDEDENDDKADAKASNKTADKVGDKTADKASDKAADKASDKAEGGKGTNT